MIAEQVRTPLPKGPMTGGRALAEVFKLAGVGPMFGMAGFQLLPYYEAQGKLYEVDGMGSIAEVARAIDEVLGKVPA